MKEKRPLRRTGPRIVMTPSEYAEVKRKAFNNGASISSYLREIALSHRMDATYTQEEMERLQDAGHVFNSFARELHIERGVLAGEKESGGMHFDKVVGALESLRAALSLTPRKTWRYDVGGFKHGNSKRIEPGKVRCTPDEWRRIKERASDAQMKQSVFIRAIALNYPVGKGAFADMAFQLSRIDNNLKQMMDVREWDILTASDIRSLAEEVDSHARELLSGRKENTNET